MDRLKNATNKLPDDALEVGQIVSAYGIRGYVKVLPYTAQDSVLSKAHDWWLMPAQNDRRSDSGLLAQHIEMPHKIRVSDIRHHNAYITAKPLDIDDRTAAEALKGQRIWISRNDFPNTTANEYYWVDLVDLVVENLAGQALGHVLGLLDNGAHSILRIKQTEKNLSTLSKKSSAKASELLIPFVARYITEVDMKQKRIVVDWELEEEA